MTLCIDQGNTRCKVAVFEADGTMRCCHSYEHFSTRELEELLAGYAITSAVLSSVADEQTEVQALLTERLPYVVRFSHQSPLPFRCDYATPATLGLDRLAAAMGAAAYLRAEAGRRAALIIDAGTAITIDTLADGCYRGGTISPGIALRLRSLHDYTARLPFLTPEEAKHEALTPPVSTRAAIAGGAVNGVVAELAGAIASFRHEYPEGQVFMTGGDGPYLHERLADSAVRLCPYLVLEGLYSLSSK